MAQLLLDQVDAGDQLGDRMLDLDPGVHLHEEPLVPFIVEDALDRAGAGVADVTGQPDRGRRRSRRAGRVDRGRLTLLDELLVAPLHRAVSLAEVQHRLAVGQHLDLDVAHARQEALDVHRAVARTRPSPPRSRRRSARPGPPRARRRASRGRRRRPPPSAAPEKPSSRATRASFRGVAHRARRVRGNRHPASAAIAARHRLVAHQLDRGAGSDRRRRGPPAHIARRRPRSPTGSRSPGEPRRPAAERACTRKTGFR